jgi:hypothetical protein
VLLIGAYVWSFVIGVGEFILIDLHANFAEILLGGEKVNGLNWLLPPHCGK